MTRRANAPPAPPGSAPRLVGLPPVVDARTRVLVLGSFPGAASLAAQQYYGHPRNHFWPIFQTILARSALLNSTVCYTNIEPKKGVEPPFAPTYAQRCQWLLAHGVGLWDVYGSCQRQGSLDADIRHAVVNDFSALNALCPRLALVAHNGGESYRHHRTLAHALAPGVAVVKLPSTSPANAAWSLARKREAWGRAILPVLAGP